MATPTPSGSLSSKHPLTSAAATATPPAIPQHLGAFSSPAPRSVPSPAAQRGQQASKSPLNPGTGPSSYGGSMSAANHPSTGSGKGIITGGLLGNSPAPLGIESPAMMGLGGVDMGISISQMGLSSSGGFGNLAFGTGSGGLSQGAGARGLDDEERRKRLEAVIGLLGARPGRVSDEGIERLAQRYGMDVQCDPPVGQNAADGVRQLAIAGQTLLIEMTSRDNAIQNVEVQWPDQTEAAFSRSAAKLLKDNLTLLDGVSRINHTLDKFAGNLERLARLDRLEGSNLNCFEAISGVHASLKKLYEHERKAALILLGDGIENDKQTSPDKQKGEVKAEREVICAKSGRPVLNGRGRIGLALDYWMDDRFISHPREKASSSDHDAMDVDNDTSSPKGSSDDQEGVYSLIIDCEHPAGDQAPVRVSSSWISDDIEKLEPNPDDLFGGQHTVIDWQEPPDTFLRNSEEPSQQMQDGVTEPLGKLPNIKFVARLDPPLPIPTQVLLYKVFPNLIEQESWRQVSYDGLILRPKTLDDVAEWRDLNSQTDQLRQTHTARNVLVLDADGSEAERLHDATLWTKPERSKMLEEIPFSHPRQLVAILPTLRQYAFLNSLLRRSFSPSTSSPISNGVNGSVSTARPALAPFPIDVRLKTFGETGTAPQLELTFPNPTPIQRKHEPKPASATGTTKPSALVSYSSDDSSRSPSVTGGGPKTSAGATNGDGKDDTHKRNADLSLDDLLADNTEDESSATGRGSTEAVVLSITLTIEPNGLVKVDAGEQNVVPPLPPVSAIPTNGTIATALDTDAAPREEAKEERSAEGVTTTAADEETKKKEEEASSSPTAEAKKDDEGDDKDPAAGKELTAAAADAAMEGLDAAMAARQEAEEQRQAELRRLGRALEVCGDLGVWVEWVGRFVRERDARAV